MKSRTAERLSSADADETSCCCVIVTQRISGKKQGELHQTNTHTHTHKEKNLEKVAFKK